MIQWFSCRDSGKKLFDKKVKIKNKIKLILKKIAKSKISEFSQSFMSKIYQSVPLC